MRNPFVKSKHTVVVSDFHLADAEPPHPRNPLWKRFKRPKLFVDRSFRRFLEFLQHEADGQIELVMNGDIFDFDSVMKIPEGPSFSVGWLEKKRGLDSSEQKSRYKIGVILRDHYVWVEALREFVQNGNKLVFIVGNHDVELHWPLVQAEIIAALDLEEKLRDNVRFCEWFYLSNGDTLIEHGNQYDSFCVCQNPIHPLIKTGSNVHVRLPFGNLAGKYMTNGMGLFNPHVESSYIKSTFWEYVVFFYRYVMRVQPFLIFTWFWGAMATLINSISEGLLPSLIDPLTVEQRVEDIAHRANSTPKVVRSLRALHVHAAIYSPYRILKELWLDRALFLIGMFLFSFWFFTVSNLFAPASFWIWFVIPFLALLPIFIFYARSVESETVKVQKISFKKIPISAQISGAVRVIHGHTHRELHTRISGVEHINTGTWSPAFHDVECRKPYGRKCFAWVKPNDKGRGRTAELHEWKDPGSEQVLPLA